MRQWTPNAPKDGAKSKKQSPNKCISPQMILLHCHHQSPYGLIQIANTKQVQATLELVQRLNNHVTTKINIMIPTSKRSNLSRLSYISVYIVKHTLSMMNYYNKLDPILPIQSTRLTNFKFVVLVTLKQLLSLACSKSLILSKVTSPFVLEIVVALPTTIPPLKKYMFLRRVAIITTKAPCSTLEFRSLLQF